MEVFNILAIIINWIASFVMGLFSAHLLFEILEESKK